MEREKNCVRIIISLGWYRLYPPKGRIRKKGTVYILYYKSALSLSLCKAKRKMYFFFLFFFLPIVCDLSVGSGAAGTKGGRRLSWKCHKVRLVISPPWQANEVNVTLISLIFFFAFSFLFMLLFLSCFFFLPCCVLSLLVGCCCMSSRYRFLISLFPSTKHITVGGQMKWFFFSLILFSPSIYRVVYNITLLFSNLCLLFCLKRHFFFG